VISYALSGALMILASPLVNVWPLVAVALAPAIAGFWQDSGLSASAAQPRRYWRVVLGGYLVGLCYAASHFCWLVEFKPAWLLPVLAGFALMPAALGLAVSLAVGSGLRGFWLLLWTALSWTAIEVLASDLLFGLPSYALGYYLWQVPLLLQTADVAGVFGISFCVMAVNVLAAQCWRARGIGRVSWWLLTLCLSALVLGYGMWRQAAVEELIEAGPKVPVRALHTDVTLEEKHDEAKTRRMLAEFIRATRDAAQGPSAAALTVWPETSLPLWLRSAENLDILHELSLAAADTRTPILVGAYSMTLSAAGKPRLSNSAFLVPVAGELTEEYHKVKLVPGAEHNPLEDWLPERWLKRWPSRMARGASSRPLDGGALQLGVFICWEAFFPRHVRAVSRAGADLLVNISNDEAAFGPLRRAYSIPLPHLVLRAIENRRFVVRSANVGASLFIAPTGDIVATSLPATTGIVQALVTPLQEQTYFTEHGFQIARGALLLWLGWTLWLAVRLGRRPEVRS
jgi:apolipoprotein N-acyltransferase